MDRMHKSIAITQLILEISQKEKQSLPTLWMYRKMAGGNLGPKVRQWVSSCCPGRKIEGLVFKICLFI